MADGGQSRVAAESSAEQTPQVAPPPARECFERACGLMDGGNNLAALAWVEQALAQAPEEPSYQSCFAVLIALERGQVRRGLELAQAAADRAGREPSLCLNVATIHLKAEQRAQAIEWLRAGLARDPTNDDIKKRLAALGVRRPPVLGFLPRANPINKVLGLIAARLGLR